MPLKAFNADGTSRIFDIVRAIYYAVDHGARVINMSFSTLTWSPEVTHAINVATSPGRDLRLVGGQLRPGDHRVSGRPA